MADGLQIPAMEDLTQKCGPNVLPVVNVHKKHAKK